MSALLLTYPEAAAQLRISRRSLERLVAARDVPTVTIGGRVLFDPFELSQFIERQKTRQRLPEADTSSVVVALRPRMRRSRRS